VSFPPSGASGALGGPPPKSFVGLRSKMQTGGSSAARAALRTSPSSSAVTASAAPTSSTRSQASSSLPALIATPAGHHAPAPEGRADRPSGMEEQVNPARVAMSLLHAVLSSGTKLAGYIHSSMQSVDGPLNRAQSEGSLDVFPCPPPYPWRGGCPPSSPRRRQRFYRTQSIRMWVNLIFAVSSWSSVGQSSGCPASAREGRALTTAQVAARARVTAFCETLIRLPWTGSGGVKLDGLHESLILEGKFSESFAREVDLSSPHVPLQADRIKFAVAPEFFDPLPFLDPFTATAYLEPETLRNREPRRQAPYPHQRHAAEVIKLARRWDAVDRLRIYPAHAVPRLRRSALTAVKKDMEYDRLILDRRGPNSEESHVGRASQGLAPGWRLTDLELAQDSNVLLYSTDLTEMFFAFRVSEARGLTNCVAAEVPFREVADTKAARVFKRAYPGHGPRSKVLLALFTEPMGDLNAVDFAQEAHAAVLEAGGSWSPDVRVLGQTPLPRGPWLEMLTVDDHCGIAMVPRTGATSEGQSKAEASFAAADAIYSQTPGLNVHPSKGVRGASQGVILGAEVDGVAGTVGSQQARRLALVRSTVLLARAGRCRGRSLRQLVGGWTFAACFQRHALSVFGEVYRALGDPKLDHEFLVLDRRVRAELLAMACLAPVLQVNIRARVVPKLYCTDASPSGGGIVSAPVSASLASELWRRRALRGGHTRLATPTEAYLIEKGDSDAAASAVRLDGPAGALPVYFDVLDVCSGPHAPLTRAASERGLVVGPRLDKQRHGYWDILNDGLFSWLIQVVAAGRVLYLHLGPPCTTFSLARKPALRGKRCPYGFEPSELKTFTGNKLYLRCLTLLRLQCLAGHPGSLEHPATSLARYLPPMLCADGRWLETICLSMCQFGAPWRKDTHLHTVNAPFLRQLGRRCAGGHDHTPLVGSTTTKAAEYPRELCAEWAALILEHRRHVDAEWPPKSPPPDTSATESVWFNSLLRGLPFKEESRLQWRRRRHINLQEVAMLRSLMRHAALEHGTDVRVAVGVDSLVTCGVCAKGRSASRALNAEWRRAVGYSLCCGVSPALHYAPSRLNPSDPPSRGREVEPPRAAPPPWASFASAEVSLSDAWGSLPLQSKKLSLWTEFVLRLCAARRVTRWGLRGVRVGEADNPGPRKSAFPVEDRPRVNLQFERGLTSQVKSSRAKLFARFTAWVWEMRSLSVAEFFLKGAEVADQILADYGQMSYESGLSLHDYSETINAVLDVQRTWRRVIQKSWDVARSWRRLAPLNSHRPIPVQILLAMQSVALLWGWWDFAGAIGIAFFGLLRPGELLSLTRSALVLPEQALNPRGRLYIKIMSSKTSSRGARHQYVRIDDEVLVPFASALWTGAPESAPLLAHTPYFFRKRWDQVLQFLGVPCTSLEGLTPASLRAGGATHYFSESRDLDLVRWQGRWLSSRMLEVYLQETVALSILPSLAQQDRDRVARFASAAGHLLRQATEAMQCGCSAGAVRVQCGCSAGPQEQGHPAPP
jgi:hypothetical protein